MPAYFYKTTPAAPLALFRLLFGLMLFGSIVRFWGNGWIAELYEKPHYFFPFYGFEFVKPLGQYTCVLFAICGLSALLVAIGLFYRVAIITLFLSFTYIELIDKSTYLNHYYFVSMVCLLLMFLPAHAYFSVDAYRRRTLLADQIPAWCIDSLKLFVAILYVFAGLAKLNSDWILHAQPLRIWLPAHNDLPIIGFLFNYPWVPYVFSVFGCIYDLSIPFLLWNYATRPFAYVAVVVFHGLTALLFPIGMFPYIMIVTGLIFFSPAFHQRIINQIGNWFSASSQFLHPRRTYAYSPAVKTALLGTLTIFFTVQLLFPLRYLLYPGELFWTEQGYRFSWRVMLMEKAGYAQFTIKDQLGHQTIVNNSHFLTPLQEKMMSTQPDMLLQYAHLLRDYYAQHGFQHPEVYVDSYVALNGRLGKPLIDPNTNLANEEDSFKPKPWITPFHDTIYGL
ncbi:MULTISPECIES: HTTM domain-containing protein [unclassified Spirosoma]|uniref:HTTM domain-containing protein n=1 Tax=unclassified Spirosoma TaxID=2621999 RepID=UPI0009660CA5|nr:MULTISPECIES: HTTM domain-containing protein [unclassified Spirosoma]MBN8822240.1 HTTM domain-containing protein [Spirosoma sp.]OJW72447.1 MAG: HTTM domain-containing protein [Spirosoma sp. 48-14]